MDTLSGEVPISNLFLSPSEKGSNLKGKNLASVSSHYKVINKVIN